MYTHCSLCLRPEHVLSLKQTRKTSAVFQIRFWNQNQPNFKVFKFCILIFHMGSFPISQLSKRENRRMWLCIANAKLLLNCLSHCLSSFLYSFFRISCACDAIAGTACGLTAHAHSRNVIAARLLDL